MRTVTVLCLLFSLLIPMSVHNVYAATATDTMTVTTDAVLKVLTDPRLKDEKQLETKKEKLWVIVDSVFDYGLLSQNSLGMTWRRITPEQQEQFSRLYALLLGKTYMDRILSYGDEKVTIGKEIALAADIAEVQTRILSKNTEIPIFYRLISRNGEWKVFDVIIEGVSLTKNYRSQFNNFLNGKSMDQLMELLEKKTNGVRPDRHK
ncbi:MlaC/ttg2D family ABC transporter substrate-binding protein [Desulfocicer niacini]